MKKIFDFILDTSAIVFTVCFILLTLPFMLFLLFPKTILLSQLVLIAPDPRHVLLLWLGNMTILSITKKILNPNYKVVDHDLVKSNQQLYFILSIMLSYYFFISYSAIGSLTLDLIVLPLFLYAVIALTHTLSTYLDTRIRLILTGNKHKNLQYWDLHKKRYFVAMFVFWIALPCFLFGIYRAYFPDIVLFLDPLVKKVVLSKRSPRINEVSPTLAYPSSTIVLKGDGFGWLQNKKDSQNRMYMGNQILYPDTWTDKEIRTTIPLDLKPGKYNISIQTQVEYNGKIYSMKSNIMAFTILSRTDGWDDQDDLYFQQMGRLGREGKDIK